MSKALIIKGANFSTNKITTITFGDVPCTAIELDESSFSLTNYTPQTIEYTVTPENTTDPITWESSDDDVATVVNGVLTAVGIGECTITVTCGEYSDTATVSVSIECSNHWYFASTAKVSGKDFVTYESSYSRISAFGKEPLQGSYVIPSSDSPVGSPYVIKLPKNTAKVKISASASTYVSSDPGSALRFMQDTPCGDTSFPNAPTLISSKTFTRASLPLTEDVPEGADSILLTVRTSQTYSSGDNPETVATTAGLSIEFLTAEET